MDQPFESDLMDEFAGESPPSALDDTFDEYDDMAEDSFDNDLLDNMEGLDEADEFSGEDEFDESFEDGFEEDLGDQWYDDLDESDALEEAVANALDAQDSDEFFRRLLGGIRRVAGVVSRGARTARRGARRAGQVAQQAQRVAGRVQQVAGRASRSAQPVTSVLRQVAPIIQQYAAQGFDEIDALEDLADRFAEEDLDEALPVLAGVAVRTMVRPSARRATPQLSQPVRRQIVRTTTQAARTLVRRQGPRAVRALPRIAQAVGQTAQRRRLPPSRLPQAIQSTIARVAASPQLVRQLARPSTRGIGIALRGRPLDVGRSRRLRIRGPVEITITNL